MLDNIRLFALAVESGSISQAANKAKLTLTTASRKLKSLEHLLFKHEKIYRSDKPSYSRLTYQLGYLHEKLGAFRKARVFYKKAFKIRPIYYKPLLKMIYLKFKK